jgi:peptidoglycan hydrolase CwlO-like protein
MLDKNISIGSLITIATIIATFIFTQGSTSNKIENIEKEQNTVVKRVDNNSSSIVNLKVSVGKIEAKLDDRFNRLEEILMDLE